jgi:hypothetical protein
MKRYLLLLLCLPFVAASQPSISQPGIVKGFCIDNGRAYYYANKTVYCRDVKSNEVLEEYEPNKDTALVGGLARRVMRVLAIDKPAEMDTAAERIRNFYVLNVSVFEHKVYLGVRFKVINKEYSRIYFALIKINEKLKAVDYFFLSGGPAQFSMPVFHGLHFMDSNTVCMAAINNEDKSKAAMGYYEFTMNGKNHSLLRSRKLLSSLKIYNNISVMHNIVLDPTIFSVANASGTLFYHHPFPILYDASAKLVCDPYNFKNKLLEIDKNFRNRNAVMCYTDNVGFYASAKAYSNIILATTQAGTMVYMAVSNADETKIDIVKFNRATGQHTITTVDIPIRDTYFVFEGNNLYYLHHDADKPVVASVAL